MSELKEDELYDILPLFYNRLFPYSSFYKWLSYGDPNYLSRREISFTLLSDIYLRHQSFDSEEEFIKELQRLKPIKIDIGAVYSRKPKEKYYRTTLLPLEKEIVFDIDLTDFDDVRTCCSGADICIKCWKFMIIACKILDATLRIDFNFHHILWVFSGRRGIHCWVCDEDVRKFNDVDRTAIAEYLQILKSGSFKGKKFNLYGDRIHRQYSRSLSIIKPYFNEMMLKEQDILGTDKRLRKFLNMIDEDIRGSLEEVLLAVQTSEERWNAFTEHIKHLAHKQMLPKNSKHIVAELMIHYTYPRLDINVSKGINHLLKAPFCIHPKTGKISIPFSVKLIDKFDPATVPTINLLINEINAYDEKTKAQQTNTDDENTSNANFSRIRDYKKTSLLKPVSTLDELIRGLESESKQKNGEDGFAVNLKLRLNSHPHFQCNQ